MKSDEQSPLHVLEWLILQLTFSSLICSLDFHFLKSKDLPPLVLFLSIPKVSGTRDNVVSINGSKATFNRTLEYVKRGASTLGATDLP